MKNAEAYWDWFSTEALKRADMVRRVAGENGILYIPLQEKFDVALKMADSSYWLIDGVHPTTMERELIKREWIKLNCL